MRKIVNSILFLFLFVFAFAYNPKVVNAAEVCVEWGDPYCIDPAPDGSCYTWQTECTQWGGVSNCGAGFYSCSTGCCEVCGGGVCSTPPPRGGGGCNSDYIINCDGEKTTEVVSSTCVATVPACKESNGSIKVGSAQVLGGCCSEKCTPNPPFEDECWCNGITVSTVTCCGAGTVSSCGNVTSQYQAWGCPSLNNPCGQNTFLNWTGTTGERCGRQITDDGSRGEIIYSQLANCQRTDWRCNCVPVCSGTAPSAPILLSPANGSSVTSPNVSLIWNNTAQNWGTSCVSNSNQYDIYIGTNPASLALLGTAGSGAGSAAFSGTSGTTYYWKVTAKNGSNSTDSAVWSFTINEGPWWQVKDGDITTTNDLTSSVPDGELFEIVGLGGFPGVPVFGSTFSLTTEPTKISDTLWNVNTTAFQSRIFNYAFFKNLIPEDVIFNDISNFTTGGSTYTDGYEWYKVTGDVTTVGDIDLGTRKVILFIENGNLNVEGNINLTDGSGFFGAFVNGNITISDQVTGTPSIEGIYLSDGVFSTGTSGLGDNQLHIRGSVASFGGINLERDLTSNANPAELFEFAPDQMILFPEKLMYRRSKWQEIAP